MLPAEAHGHPAPQHTNHTNFLVPKPSLEHPGSTLKLWKQSSLPLPSYRQTHKHTHARVRSVLYTKKYVPTTPLQKLQQQQQQQSRLQLRLHVSMHTRPILTKMSSGNTLSKSRRIGHRNPVKNTPHEYWYSLTFTTQLKCQYVLFFVF